MKLLTEVSVADGVAIGFTYETDKYLSVMFDHYFDVRTDALIETPCTLSIKNWDSALVKEDSIENSKWHELEEKLGIISMIFSIEVLNNFLELYVITLDNRYLHLRFANSSFGYIILK